MLFSSSFRRFGTISGVPNDNIQEYDFLLVQSVPVQGLFVHSNASISTSFTS